VYVGMYMNGMYISYVQHNRSKWEFITLALPPGKTAMTIFSQTTVVHVIVVGNIRFSFFFITFDIPKRS
jgi:hypothetical protein